MTPTLRILLVIAALGLLFFIRGKIKSGRLEIMDSLFWLIFSFLLVLNALFPQLATASAHFLGVESTSNFVFLCVIGALVIKSLSLSAKLSLQKARIDALAQHLALDAKENEEKQASHQA